MTTIIQSGGVLEIGSGAIMTGTAVPSAEPTIVGSSNLAIKEIPNNGSFSASMRGIHWKPDGSRCFAVSATNSSGSNSGALRHYDTSTYELPADMNVFTELSVGLPNCHDVFLKPDGTSLFLLANAVIREYTLSTAWDVSSAVANGSNTFNTGILTTVETGMFFNSTGTLLFYCDSFNEVLHKRTLSTPWDLTTASGTDSLADANFETISDIWFSPSGKTLITAGRVSGGTPGRFIEYTLDTAFDIAGTVNFVAINDTTGHSQPDSLSIDGGFLWAMSAGPERFTKNSIF